MEVTTEHSPLVSIIIPTFNRAHLIGETLDSVLAQTYKNWECIVVDDGSNDGTAALLDTYCAKDSRIQYYQRSEDKPKGANACRNLGKRQAKGRFLMFLDSDDLLLPNCLLDRVNCISGSSINVLISNTARLFSDAAVGKTMNVDPNFISNEAYLLLFLSYKLPWTIMDALWNVNLLKDIWFDETLQRFQDVDFHIRVLMGGNAKIKRQFKVDTYYRHSQVEKQVDIELYNHKVLSSFKAMLQKAVNWPLNVSRRLAFKRYCYIVFRDFLYSGGRRKLKAHLFFIDKVNSVVSLSVIDYFFFYTMVFYNITGLNLRKSTGSYRFIKKANEHFDNLIQA